MGDAPWAAALLGLGLVGCAGSEPTPAPRDRPSTALAKAQPEPVPSASPSAVETSSTTQPRVVGKSDDCAGAELASGACECAHTRCMDICCPLGWACAHHAGPDQGAAKCVRPR